MKGLSDIESDVCLRKHSHPPQKKRNNGQLQDASMRQGHKSNTVVALYQVQLVILILLLSSAVFSYMLLDFVPDGLLNLFFFDVFGSPIQSSPICVCNVDRVN